MRGAAAEWVALGLMLAGSACAAPPPLIDDSGRIEAGWRVRGLPKQRAPLTQFSVARVDGVQAVRVQADASYGNLAHAIEPPLMARQLQWRWRLEQGNPQADLSERSGDDVALRVCLSFALPFEQVPFIDRQLLRVGQAAAGEALPTATLCYIWDSHLAPGTLLPNAFTRRVRYIVLRGPQDALAQWVDERRDVAADFRRAYGDESAAVLPVDGLSIGADSDNTRLSTVGHVAQLKLE